VPSIIDSMYSDTSQLLGLLGAQGEPSIQSFANSNLRKVLLLSAASWFETRISNALQKFSTIHSNGHPGIESLIKGKAIERQYHTYFDWKKKKPGPFYALFGDVCGDQLEQLVKADADLKDALAAFLELGSLRNELVHKNFAAFPFEKTTEEVYALYQRAESFVLFVETKMQDQNFGRVVQEAE
jgi:RiboL-PSP-HEPN